MGIICSLCFDKSEFITFKKIDDKEFQYSLCKKCYYKWIKSGKDLIIYIKTMQGFQ